MQCGFTKIAVCSIPFNIESGDVQGYFIYNFLFILLNDALAVFVTRRYMACFFCFLTGIFDFLLISEHTNKCNWCGRSAVRILAILFNSSIKIIFQLWTMEDVKTDVSNNILDGNRGPWQQQMNGNRGPMATTYGWQPWTNVNNRWMATLDRCQQTDAFGWQP